MNIIFLGTSNFAVAALEKLADSHHEIQAVFTQPDRPSGRGLETRPAPVKIAAQNRDLCIFQPSEKKDLLQQLKGLTTDLLVVVSYGYILTPEMLRIVPLGAINLHASFLPAYRGAAPVNWAIVEGQSHTGVSVIKMNEFIDQGPVIIQKQVKILDSDDALTLSERLSRQGADILLEAIDLIEQGRARFVPQDDSQATFAPKLDKEKGLINWSWPAVDIGNRIRAFIPWPGCYTFYKGKMLKIWKAQAQQDKINVSVPAPGTVTHLDKEKGIVVQTGRGQILIAQLQLEGRKKMTSTDFMVGRQINTGDVLG